MPDERRGLVALIIGAALIGLGPLLVRTSECGALATGFWRMALAAPIALAFVGWTTNRTLDRTAESRPWRWAWIAGLCFAGDLAFWHWAILLTTIANATLLSNLAPILVALIAWTCWRQPPGWAFAAGIALAIPGAILLTGAGLGGSHLLGDLSGLASAVFYAGYQLAVIKLRRSWSAAQVMAATTAIAALALLPVAGLAGERILPVTSAGWAAVAGLAIVVHLGGQGLIAWGLAHRSAASASAVLLVQPVVAAISSWIIYRQERPGPAELAGAVLVLAGIALAARRREQCDGDQARAS